MNERERWLFEHFLAMETKYEEAAAELRILKAPLRFLVDAETKKRVVEARWLRKTKRKIWMQ